MTETTTLYDEDFVAWSKQQAAALRAAAAAGSNLQLDWANLAEEIEDLGKSYARSLRARIMRIIQHLVKLEHSPAIDPRKGWRHSIRGARVQIAQLLKDNPSLRREVPPLIGEITNTGIELAIIDLEEHAEIDTAGLAPLRRTSYTAEQILGEWFPPEPAEASSDAR